jgi:LPXTG-site transpeptidase (sortase) family protein
MLTKHRTFLALTTCALIVLGLYIAVPHGKKQDTRPPLPAPAAKQPTKQVVIASQPAPQASPYELDVEKISVKSPIVMDVDARNKNTYAAALKKGVAHMLGTAHPGEKDNMVLFAHSSVSAKYRDQYSPIFARLAELQTGDKITIKHLKTGRTYQYTVQGKKTVDAGDTSMIQPSRDERLTLSTCWPVGSNKSRLIVWATR